MTAPNHGPRVMVDTTQCMLYAGYKLPLGYGTIGHNIRAHRLFYELYKGKIPEGLEIDHLCRVRCCINPDHLEAVTHKENIARSIPFSRPWAFAESCKNGHERTEKNTYISTIGIRYCRRCIAISRAKSRERKKVL